jgi:SAM-dependent methyltransferase
MKDVFEKIYNENLWANAESVSGAGSTMEATEAVRNYLPDIVRDYGVKTMLDIPCGDFNWFRDVLPKLKQLGMYYIGADIVPDLIEKNKQRYPEAHFEIADITTSRLQQVDMVLVRDLFGHLSNEQVQMALANLRSSKSRYLLATTFPQEAVDGDLETGQWRPINLARLWGLPAPLQYWPETKVDFGDHVSMKCLGLWDLRRW